MTRTRALFTAQIVAHMDIIRTTALCGTQQRMQEHGAAFAALTDTKHTSGTVVEDEILQNL